MDPSIRGSAPGGIQPLSPGGGDQRTGAAEQKQASFPSGNRTVSVTDADSRLSLQTADSDDLSDVKVSDKTISERKTENVTDKKPGRLRRALSWGKAQGGKVKGYASDKWESAKSSGKSAARGAAYVARNPKTATIAAAKGTASYVHDKLSAAKSKGSSAAHSAAAGMKALKNNPKGTLAAGGAKLGRGVKSIKDSAVSIPQNIKRKMPSRPKSFHLPSFKSLKMRSAKSVPPPPSASVKAAIDTAAKKAENYQTRLGEAGDSVKQAKAGKENLQNLVKLLDDPSGFYKSGVDVEVTWGDETVRIHGQGLTKAQTVDQAMHLASAHRSEIRAEVKNYDERIQGFKSGKKELKSEHKKEVSELRQSTAAAEKESYTEKANELKATRKSIKTQIALAEQFLKEAVTEGKENAEENKVSLKAQLKVDTEHLKAFKKEAKSERAAAEKEAKEVKQELKETRAAIKKFEKQQAKASKSYEQKAVAEGLKEAQAKETSLLEQLSAVRVKLETKLNDLRPKMDELTESVELLQQTIKATKEAGSGSDVYNELSEQLEQAREELKANTKEIRELQRQHKADKKHIKKMK